MKRFFPKRRTKICLIEKKKIKENVMQMQSVSYRILKILPNLFSIKKYLLQFFKKDSNNIKLFFCVFSSFFGKKGKIIKKKVFSILLFPFEEIFFDFNNNSKKIMNLKFSKISKNLGRNFIFSIKIYLN
jgi:hypothetical protein